MPRSNSGASERDKNVKRFVKSYVKYIAEMQQDSENRIHFLTYYA